MTPSLRELLADAGRASESRFVTLRLVGPVIDAVLAVLRANPGVVLSELGAEQVGWQNTRTEQVCDCSPVDEGWHATDEDTYEPVFRFPSAVTEDEQP